MNSRFERVLGRMPVLRTKLFRAASVYTLSSILNASIPFLLMPILTRFLTPADYGVMVTFQLLNLVVSAITGMSIHGAIGRQYVEKDRIDFPVFIGNCLFILAGSALLMMLVVAIGQDWIARLASFPKAWLPLVILVASCQFLSLCLLTILQMEGKASQYGLLQVSQTGLNLGSSVALVAGLGLGWRGGVLGQAFAIVVVGLASLAVMFHRRMVRFKYDKKCIILALQFGAPLIPHALGAALLGITDRIMINNMIGLAATGIFSVGYQVGMVILLVQNSFNQAWVPFVFEKLAGGSEEDRVGIVRATYVYFVVILAASIALGLIAPLFLKVIAGKEFRGGAGVVFWIGLGYAFNGMYKMVSVYLFYSMRTYLLGLVTIFTAGLNVACCYFLITWQGAVGAAQATALAFFVSFLLTWYFSARTMEMPWSKWNIFGST